VEAGQFSCFDALPKDLAKVILQDFELHGPEYSTGLSRGAERYQISTGWVCVSNLD
jgi:hypothetical protein